MPTTLAIKTGIPYCQEANRHCTCFNCTIKTPNSDEECPCKSSICINCLTEESDEIITSIDFEKKILTHFYKDDKRHEDYALKHCKGRNINSTEDSLYITRLCAYLKRITQEKRAYNGR